MAVSPAIPVDATALADELARRHLIAPALLEQLATECSGTRAVDLANCLIARGVLTQFQAARALAGEASLLALGPYRSIGPAGRGTLGPLLLATHVGKPGLFVIRALPLRSLRKSRQAKQIVRTLAGGALPPAIIPLVEVDSANGYHYLAWPHAEGERLSDRVATSGPLSPAETVAVLATLADALAGCHTRKIVHGAITPRSILFSSTGPRLLETGVGLLLSQSVTDDESLFESLSAAAASAEVLTFAAPEIAANPDMLTPAADQYALGAVGYFALTGLPPYPHPTLAEQLRAKQAGPPPSAAVVNPAVPRELSELLDRLMAPDPAARFPSLAEVHDQLATLAAVGPVEPPQSDLPISLSELQAARESSVSNSWDVTRSGGIHPAERDQSAASVTFELPAAETIPDTSDISALRPQPGGHVAAFVAFEPPPVPPPSHDELDAPALPPNPCDWAAPRPVVWHSVPATTPSAASAYASHQTPPHQSVLWKTVKRNLLFWKAPTDVVQVSVYGPTGITPGQTIRLAVYLHTPETASNVHTLARAFLLNAELIGTGYVSQEVPRPTLLAIHLSVANAGVSQSLVPCKWRGQPQRVGFELHVPWESPEGPSPGLVSIGQNDTRIGKIEFWFNVLPRRA